MELFGSDARGLYLLNQELKARVYSAPSLVL
jgi:ferritin